MGYRKRQILTIRLIFTPGPPDDVVKSREIRRKPGHGSFPRLVPANTEQRFGARVHIHDAVVGRNSNQCCCQIFQNGLGRRDGMPLVCQPRPPERAGAGGSVLFGLFGFRTDVLCTVKVTGELSIRLFPVASWITARNACVPRNTPVKLNVRSPDEELPAVSPSIYNTTVCFD